MSLKITVAAVFLSTLTSCRPAQTQDASGDSIIKGYATGVGLRNLLPPLPKSASELTRLSRTLIRQSRLETPMKSQVGQLRSTLYSAIISGGGIPRNQIREVMIELVAESSTACAGISCKRILGFAATDVDRLLDEALLAVRQSSRLSQPDMIEKRSVLTRSLERSPEWLNRQDFGPELTPRKAYDLSLELKTYKECPACKISADPSHIETMIEGSRLGDHFVWALRPDGHLVVGRGPDEKMSHGVLGSINLVDESKTGSVTLSVLASGEGYIDPLHQKLVINNKSGHYRPEFHRVNNPTIKTLFSKLAPTSIKDVTFVDQTKPR
jgi:hypothetical protein